MTNPATGSILWSHALLNRIRPEDTTDREEAVDIVSEKFASHTIAPLTNRVEFSMQSGSFDELTVHVMDYGAPIIVKASLLESRYILVIPATGNSQVSFDSRSWEFDPRTPILLPPDREFSLAFSDRCGQALITIPTHRMERILLGFFGERPVPQMSEPVFALRSSAGRALILEIQALYEDVNSGASSLLPHPLSLNVSDAFIARLVSAFFGEDHLPRQGTGAQRHKIIDAFLLLAKSTLDLTPVEASTKLNIPLRTLQDIVKEELCLTPTQIINQARLDSAYELLVHSDPTQTTVAQIARRSGFGHVGRFSVQYRDRFHEKPSETLRRGG